MYVCLLVRGHPLQAIYYGPYEIKNKFGDVRYVVKALGGRTDKRVCHINMLQRYFERYD